MYIYIYMCIYIYIYILEAPYESTRVFFPHGFLWHRSVSSVLPCACHRAPIFRAPGPREGIIRPMPFVHMIMHKGHLHLPDFITCILCSTENCCRRVRIPTAFSDSWFIQGEVRRNLSSTSREAQLRLEKASSCCHLSLFDLPQKPPSDQPRLSNHFAKLPANKPQSLTWSVFLFVAYCRPMLNLSGSTRAQPDYPRAPEAAQRVGSQHLAPRLQRQAAGLEDERTVRQLGGGASVPRAKAANDLRHCL